MVDTNPDAEAPSGTRPFFIIGGRHSGSESLYRVLSAHPEIALTNEAQLVNALCFCFEYCTQPAGTINIEKEFRGVVHADVIPRFSEIFFTHTKQMLEDYYAAAFDKPFKRWGDTMSDPGWAMAAQRIFPDVQFVVQVRDPRDVFCAQSQDGIRAGAAFEVRANMPAQEEANSWNNTYEYILKEPGDQHLLTYEQLVADPVDCASKVLGFLGLEMDPAVERAAADLGSDDAGVGRWEGTLDAAEVSKFEELCGTLMKQFGYL
jgi:hypothetical protein